MTLSLCLLEHLLSHLRPSPQPQGQPEAGRRVVLPFLLGLFLVTALAVAAAQGPPGDILSWSAPRLALSQHVHLVREASFLPGPGPG